MKKLIVPAVLLLMTGTATLAQDKVIAKLKDRLNTLYLGNPLDKNTDIGAINSKKQLETNIGNY